MTKESRKSRMVRGFLFLLAGVGILLLIIVVIAIADMRIKLDELGNQILYLQDTTDIIQTDVNNMEANIEATLEEEASLIEEYAIVVSDCDFASGTYDVAISVIPKEYTGTTQTSIYFGTQEYPLELDGFAFCGTATLPMDVSYDGNVTILFTDGDRRSTEVLQNYVGFQQSLSGILEGNIANLPFYKDGTLTIRDNAAVNLDGNGIFEFTELKLIVTADDQEIYNYDLLTNTGGVIGQEAENTAEDMDEDSAFSVDHGEAAGADGASADESAATDQDAESTGETAEEEDDDISDDTPQENIGGAIAAADAAASFSTERELNLDQELAPESNVRIFLSATTSEGYRFVYDLFNGVTSETEANGFMPSDDYFADNYAMYDRKGTAYRIK